MNPLDWSLGWVALGAVLTLVAWFAYEVVTAPTMCSRCGALIDRRRQEAHVAEHAALDEAYTAGGT